MNKLFILGTLCGLLILLIGCVTPIYKPGAPNNPINKLKLGQTYNDMVKTLGNPDQSRSENRMTQEVIVLFIPIWNIVEWIGDFNPSMMQVYSYRQWGSVTIDNNNHIIRVEAI